MKLLHRINAQPSLTNLELSLAAYPGVYPHYPASQRQGLGSVIRSLTDLLCTLALRILYTLRLDPRMIAATA